MTTREVVETAYNALSAGDGQTFIGLLADDVTLHEPDNHPAPGFRGDKQAVLADFAAIGKGMGLRGVKIHEIIAEGERAVGIVDAQCTTKSGKEIDVPIAELWTVRDGLVREIKPYYFDTAAFMAAMAE